MNKAKPRILIVEDEEMVRINLEDFLEDDGFAVRAVGSGEQGLEVLDVDLFDAVIVDMRLPGIDGNAFIRAAGKKQPDLRFLIHTGSADYSLPSDIMELGVTSEQILLKPVADMRIISQIITTLLTGEK